MDWSRYTGLRVDRRPAEDRERERERANLEEMRAPKNFFGEVDKRITALARQADERRKREWDMRLNMRLNEIFGKMGNLGVSPTGDLTGEYPHPRRPGAKEPKGHRVIPTPELGMPVRFLAPGFHYRNSAGRVDVHGEQGRIRSFTSNQLVVEVGFDEDVGALSFSESWWCSKIFPTNAGIEPELNMRVETDVAGREGQEIVIANHIRREGYNDGFQCFGDGWIHTFNRRDWLFHFWPSRMRG